MGNGNWLDLTKKSIFKQLYKNRKLKSLNIGVYPEPPKE